MGALRNLEGRSVMASRWRRRRMCVLVSDAPAPAALRAVSATGALLETNAQPPVGSRVELRHPEAGSIMAEVRTLADEGVTIAFDYGEQSVAFALAAIAADMSRPTA
jgi:hypothetical protein